VYLSLDANVEANLRRQPGTLHQGRVDVYSVDADCTEVRKRAEQGCKEALVIRYMIILPLDTSVIGFEKPAPASSLETNECLYQRRGDIRATKSSTPNRKGGDVRNQACIVADIVQVFCTNLSEAESSISKEFGKDLA